MTTFLIVGAFSGASAYYIGWLVKDVLRSRR